MVLSINHDRFTTILQNSFPTKAKLVPKFLKKSRNRIDPLTKFHQSSSIAFHRHSPFYKIPFLKYQKDIKNPNIEYSSFYKIPFPSLYKISITLQKLIVPQVLKRKKNRIDPIFPIYQSFPPSPCLSVSSYNTRPKVFSRRQASPTPSTFP